MSARPVETAEKSGSRRLAFLAALGLLALFGAVGGAFLRARWGPTGGPRDTGRGGRLAATLSERAAAAWTKLLSAFSGPAARGMNADALIKLLAALSRDPLAEAFAEDFLRDPELRRLWEEFRAGGKGRDPEWLARRLSESKSFVALLNRYARHRRFLNMGDRLARSLLGEDPAQSTAFSNSDGWAADGRAADFRGAVGSARAAAPRGPGASAAEARAGGARAAKGGRAGAGAGESPGPAPGEPGNGEHDALSLVTLDAAGPSRAMDPWASLCFQGSSIISREQCRAINRNLGDDALWTACLKANLLDKCVALCRGNLELGCASEAREMQRCRERFSEAACADACGRGDCGLARNAPGPDVASLPREREPEREPERRDDPPDGPPPGPGADEQVPIEDPRAAPENPPETSTPEPGAGPGEPGDGTPTVQLGAIPRPPAVAPSSPPPAPPPRKKKRNWLDEFFDWLGDLFG
ncbi:MAG: hypothetical protein HY553_05435 [Elusimicrobia bacterium]|nr:hypothetical protein [Elusimicrobiota bacterium]